MYRLIQFQPQIRKSPLAFRLALRDPVEETAVKVLITSLDEQSLDQDILLRLAKSTLFPIIGV